MVVNPCKPNTDGLFSSYTDILCFNDPAACSTKWQPKFQHALVATIIICAVFLIKVVLVEGLIIRAALRSLYVNNSRANQVIESSAWLLDIVTPDTNTRSSEGSEHWLVQCRQKLRFWMQKRPTIK